MSVGKARGSSDRKADLPPPVRGRVGVGLTGGHPGAADATAARAARTNAFVENMLRTASCGALLPR